MSRLDVSSIVFKDIISGPILDVSSLDVSSIIFKDTISGPLLDISHIDVSSIIFKDTISGPILDVSRLDVSSIIFKDTISGPILDVSRLDVSSIIFKDTISGPILDVNNLININTISGTNLFFDVSKIDISGTIDLSFSFRPKFFIPSSRNDVSVNEIYYDLSNSDGILMIKLTS